MTEPSCYGGEHCATQRSAWGPLLEDWEMADRYLSRTEVAARLGISPNTLSRYKLPPADAVIGGVRGWLPETIDAWHAARPGQGARTDLRDGKN